MNADERLRELIFGGPGDRRLWTIMVILAARADEAGLVPVPDTAEVAEWIEKSEQWADWCLKELRKQGWVHSAEPKHRVPQWDIGRELRQGSVQRQTY